MIKDPNFPLPSSDSYVLLPMTSEDITSSRSHNGAYRIGSVVRPTSEVSLRALGKMSKVTTMNGDIPLNRDHHNIHVYGESVNGQRHFQFKMVVEDRDDGAVYAKIKMIDTEAESPTTKTLNEVEGFVINSNRPNGEIDLMSPTDNNTITLQTKQGTAVINIGKVHLLVVDCGVLEKSPEFTVHEEDGQITIFNEIDLTKPGKDPLFANSIGSTPSLTIPPSRIAHSFEQAQQHIHREGASLRR